MIPEDIINMFQNDKYQMVIINSNYEMATDELNEQVTKVNEIIRKYDENAILAGEGPLMKDLVEISDHDFNSVNTVSIRNYIRHNDCRPKINFTSSSFDYCYRVCNIYQYGYTFLYK